MGQFFKYHSLPVASGPAASLAIPLIESAAVIVYASAVSTRLNCWRIPRMTIPVVPMVYRIMSGNVRMRWPSMMYRSTRSCAVNRVIQAKTRKHMGPRIQPIPAWAYGRASTPLPITAVIMCAEAVHLFPLRFTPSSQTQRLDPFHEKTGRNESARLDLRGICDDVFEAKSSTLSLWSISSYA